jgi:hypothetical protein
MSVNGCNIVKNEGKIKLILWIALVDILPPWQISQINMYQIQTENIKARLLYGLFPEI